MKHQVGVDVQKVCLYSVNEKSLLSASFACCTSSENGEKNPLVLMGCL